MVIKKTIIIIIMEIVSAYNKKNKKCQQFFQFLILKRFRNLLTSMAAKISNDIFIIG